MGLDEHIGSDYHSECHREGSVSSGKEPGNKFGCGVVVGALAVALWAYNAPIPFYKTMIEAEKVWDARVQVVETAWQRFTEKK